MKKVIKKKNNAGQNAIVFGIIIIFLVVMAILLFVIKNNSLDTDSDLINELYSYVGGSNLEVCNGLANYSEDAIDYDDVDNSMRICNSYNLLDNSIVKEDVILDKNSDSNTCNLNETIKFATDNYEDDICTITKISSDDINNQYKKMYGKDIENYESFQYDPTNACYYDNGYYYCGLSESYTYTIGSEPHTYRSIKKAEEKNDEIIIYDYFLRIENDECYISYNDSKKNEKCTKHYDNGKEISYNFLKNYGTLFKHTFQKNGDDYYWVKSEPIT